MSEPTIPDLVPWLDRQGVVPVNARSVEVLHVIDEGSRDSAWAVVRFRVWPTQGRPFSSELRFPMDAELHGLLYNDERPAQPEG